MTASHVIVTHFERAGKAPTVHVYGGYRDRPEAQREARKIIAETEPQNRASLRVTTHKLLFDPLRPEVIVATRQEDEFWSTTSGDPAPELGNHSVHITPEGVVIRPIPEPREVEFEPVAGGAVLAPAFRWAWQRALYRWLMSTVEKA